MHQIQSQAYRFLLKNRISLPVSKDELMRVIERRGWQILSYHEAEPIFAANDKVAEKRRLAGEACVSLRDYAARQDAFTLIGEPSIIFYRETMGHSQMLEAILHEMAHLALGHNHHSGILGKNGDSAQRDIQEQEADVFTYEVLAPQPVLRRCHIESPDDIVATDLLDERQSKRQYHAMRQNRRYRASALEARVAYLYRGFIRHANYSSLHNILAICARAAVVLCLAGILVFGGAGSSLLSGCQYSPPVQQSGQSQPTAQPGQVAVTKSGDCYHRPDCSYAGGAIAYLSAREAEARGYRPCGHCMDAGETGATAAPASIEP